MSLLINFLITCYVINTQTFFLFGGLYQVSVGFGKLLNCMLLLFISVVYYYSVMSLRINKEIGFSDSKFFSKFVLSFLLDCSLHSIVRLWLLLLLLPLLLLFIYYYSCFFFLRGINL